MKIDVSFYLLVYPSPRGEERGFAVCNFRCSLMDSCARAELNRLQTDKDSTRFGRGGFLSEYKMCLSTTNLAKSLFNCDACWIQAECNFRENFGRNK